MEIQENSNPDQVYTSIYDRASLFLGIDELSIFDRAYYLARDSHGSQSRDSGEAYIYHPLAVTSFLVDMRMDLPTLAAALLHDVIEDTGTGLQVVEREFGKDIAGLVDGVTKLGKVKPPPGASEELQSVLIQAETFDKMMLATADDIRVILIKLADRLHNMKTIQALPITRRRKVVASTVLIYIPMAARLGIWLLKSEMEDLALQALETETFNEISFVVENRRLNHQTALSSIRRLVMHRLDEVGIPVEVFELPDSISEIYRFSKQSGIAVDQVQDVVTTCAIVPRILDCYSALGVIHSLWKPLPGRVDDYIVSPKGNLYRSLHTTVVGPGGLIIKFRIRTREMDEWANYGIYAYWRNRGPGFIDGKPEDRIAWLSRMSEWRKELRIAWGDIVDEEALVHEFVESLMSDFLPEHIDVFTPKGKVIELPKGATALDFAYKIHTDLGHSSRAVRVNDRPQPINQPLINGDQVLILRVPKPEPQYEWLNPELGYIKTSLARQSIKRWFRRQDIEFQIERGQVVLFFEFSLIGIDQLDLQFLAGLMGFDNKNLFLAKLGSADLNPSDVAKIYLEEVYGLKTNRNSDSRENMTIDGVGPLKIRIAKCCNPMPGSSIVGVVIKDDQVTVHRIECRYALKAMDSGKFLALNWKETDQSSSPVIVSFEAYDRKELLNDFSAIVGQENINMSQVFATTDKSTNMATIQSILEIQNSNQLLRILHRTAHMPNVINVNTQFMSDAKLDILG